MKRSLVLKLFAAAMLLVGSFVAAPILKADAACDAACAAQCTSTGNCVVGWCNFDGTCGQLILL